MTAAGAWHGSRATELPAALLQAEPRQRRSRLVVWLPAGAALGGFVLVVLVGFVFAVAGGSFGCLGGASDNAGPRASRSARRDIPPARLRLYQQAGRRFDIDWTFLASIGAQECNHDGCAGTNQAGCAGPMQIGVGGRCGDIWDRYRTDGNGDGHTDVNDPADAIFTAARILRQAKGAPATGGSYNAYRQAACGYYGACTDAAVSYADEVMARAVQYGFRGRGAPAPSDPGGAQPALTTTGGGCDEAAAPVSGGLGQVRRLFSPRRLARLPAATLAPGAGSIECDARIVPDVVTLTRRYRVRVSACYAIHSLAGEHPLGAATDLVPADGDWHHTLALAKAIGWKPSCAATGTAPGCARPPFRFIGYNGFPDHGDPAHCVPCAGGPHLHLSWLTSSSPGEPDNRPRTSYSPARWIEVLEPLTGGRAV